jgi:predicted NBD/HSP70 family sugar kinase
MKEILHSHRGSNQGGLKQYNENTIISLLRQQGPLTKAEIARITHLSPQTVSLIFKRFIKKNIVLQEDYIYGKMGQPSAPFSLNPEAAFSIGVSIGRHQLDISLIDFKCKILKQYSIRYDFPDVKIVLKKISQSLKKIFGNLSPDQLQRLVGVGISQPDKINKWGEVFGIDINALNQWDDVNIVNEVKTLAPQYEVIRMNDVYAACLAELFLGNANKHPNFQYIYLGSFIGGAIVLNGQLFRPGLLNTSTIGTIPIHTPSGYQQLNGLASLISLEQDLRKKGLDPKLLIMEKELPPEVRLMFDAWLEYALEAIKWSIVSVNSVISTNLVIIDAHLSKNLIAEISKKLINLHDDFHWEATEPITIESGTIGKQARALGSAIIPFNSVYGLSQSTLLKYDSVLV